MTDWYKCQIISLMVCIYTLFREGTYLTIVVNHRYGPQTITIAIQNTINY